MKRHIAICLAVWLALAAGASAASCFIELTGSNRFSAVPGTPPALIQ